MSSNLVDEYDSDQDSDQGSDQAGALLEGFDNDSEDLAQDEGFDKDKPTVAIPNYKKTHKKLTQAAQKGNKDGPGTVYIGRIPHGFYENEMRQYFSQFGTITKLRLSRNRKTGHSKHFAFMEFESTHVAKIVAETMDNYLMFGHILKCKYVPPDSLHPETFKGANKRFRVAPHNRIEKRALEAPKSESQWTKKISKEQTKREKKAEKLKAMGYDIELPKLKNPTDVLQQRESQTKGEEKGPDTAEANGKEAVLALTAVSGDEVAPSNKKSKKEKKMGSSAGVEGKDAATLNAAPRDEVSVSKKKSKKDKKGTTSTATEGKEISDLDERKKSDPAAAEAIDVSTSNTVPSHDVALSKKKSKKEKKGPIPAIAEDKDGLALDEEKAGDDDVPALHAVPSDGVSLSKKAKKEKKRKDISGADSKESLVPVADAKDEPTPSKKKSKKEKKADIVSAEMNGVTLPTADSNAHISDPLQSQNGVIGSSEKRDKRKEKREKTKNKAKQLAPALTGDEESPTVKDRTAKPGSLATMPVSDSTKADQSTEQKEKKKKKKKAKGESAPVATTDTPASATAEVKLTSAEEASPLITPVKKLEDGKSSRRSRKRKGSEAGNEMAESEPKPTQPFVTEATEAKSKRKKAKKA